MRYHITPFQGGQVTQDVRSIHITSRNAFKMQKTCIYVHGMFDMIYTLDYLERYFMFKTK